MLRCVLVVSVLVCCLVNEMQPLAAEDFIDLELKSASVKVANGKTYLDVMFVNGSEHGGCWAYPNLGYLFPFDLAKPDGTILPDPNPPHIFVFTPFAGCGVAPGASINFHAAFTDIGHSEPAAGAYTIVHDGKIVASFTHP